MLTILPASQWQPDTEGAYDIPESIYRPAPGINFSILKHFAKCPMAARQAMLAPEKDTPSRAMLRAVHCAILEPERFESEQIADSLTPAKKATAMGIYHRVKHDLDLQHLLRTGQAEVSIFAWDSKHEVLRKCRIDLLRFERNIYSDIDFKTVGDINRFEWDAVKNRWFEQRVHYAECIQILTGCQVVSGHAVVEDDSPHCRTIFPIDHDHPLFLKARATVDGWLEQYAKCMKTGIWDDYPLYSEFKKPGYQED